MYIHRLQWQGHQALKMSGFLTYICQCMLQLTCIPKSRDLLLPCPLYAALGIPSATMGMLSVASNPLVRTACRGNTCGFKSTTQLQIYYPSSLSCVVRSQTTILLACNAVFRQQCVIQVLFRCTYVECTADACKTILAAALQCCQLPSGPVCR